METQPLLKSSNVDSRVPTNPGNGGTPIRDYGTSNESHREWHNDECVPSGSSFSENLLCINDPQNHEENLAAVSGTSDGNSRRTGNSTNLQTASVKGFHSRFSNGNDVGVRHQSPSNEESFDRLCEKDGGRESHPTRSRGDRRKPHRTSTTLGQRETRIPQTTPGEATETILHPKPPQEGVSKDMHGGDANPRGDEIPVDSREQRVRMVLLTTIGFLTACAGKIHSPLMTQYTYQVYTERLFGNLSVGVKVSKDPCLANSTSSSPFHTHLLAQQVQDQSAHFLARTELIDGGVSIVVNLFLGSYSDYVGRRKALLLPLLGHVLRNAAAPVVIYFDLGLPGMYVGYLLDGLGGGSCGILQGLYCYAADITKAGGQRTVGTTVVAGSITLGEALLYVLAGLFIQDTGFFYPALVATILEVLCVLLVLQLPETVPRERKKMISPVTAVSRVVRTFVPRGEPYKQALLLLSLLGLFLNTLCAMGMTSLESLYLMDEPFCWSSLSQGILGSARYTSSQLATFVLVKLLRNTVSAPLLVVLGLLSDMGKNLLLALARNDLQVYLVIVAGLARSLIYPAMRSFMSSLSARDRQGAVFAGIAILESVCQCLGQTTVSAIYTNTLTFMRGFVFLVIVAVQFAVASLYLINQWLYRKYLKSRVTAFSVQSTGTQTDDVTINGGHTTESFTARRHASI